MSVAKRRILKPCCRRSRKKSLEKWDREGRRANSTTTRTSLTRSSTKSQVSRTRLWKEWSSLISSFFSKRKNSSNSWKRKSTVQMTNRFRLKSTNWKSNCWKPGSGLGPRMTLWGLYLAVKNTGDKTTTESARNSAETLARFSSTPRCSGPGSMNWLIRKRSLGSSKTGRKSCKPRNNRSSSWNGNRADATKSISTTLFTVNASQSFSPTKTTSFWPMKPWSMDWRTWLLSKNT